MFPGTEKKQKKSLKKTIKKALRGENLFKLIIIVATLALILTAILPYVLI